MTKRLLAALLLCTILLSLAACGKGAAPEPQEEGAMTPGYLPSEIPIPEELGALDAYWDADEAADKFTIFIYFYYALSVYL